MDKKRIIRTILLSIVTVAIIIACYTIYNNSKQKNVLVLPNQQTDKKKLPDINFTLTDLKGKTVKLSDYKGKIVVLNFWATWCGHCKNELPQINEVYKELSKRNDAAVLTVHVGSIEQTVYDLFTKVGYELPTVMDYDGSVGKAVCNSNLPTTFIINKDGSTYTSIQGETDKDTILKAVNSIQ